MQTKKSHEIPEKEWDGAPGLNDWVAKAQTARIETATKRVRAESLTTPKKRLASVESASFKPINQDHVAHFNAAKGREIIDVGLNGKEIVVTFASGRLTMEFIDHTLLIEPHADGKPIPFHEVKPDPLVDIYAFIPNENDHREACILVIKGENQNLEYLIRPALTSNSLAFYLEYEDQNA